MVGATRRGFLGALLGMPLLGFLRWGKNGGKKSIPSIQIVERPETDLIGYSNNSWIRGEYYFQPWPSLIGRDVDGDLHCKGVFISAWDFRPKPVGEIFKSEESIHWFTDRVVSLLESGTVPLGITRPSNQDGVIVQVANLKWPKILPYEVFPIEVLKIPKGWFA